MSIRIINRVLQHGPDQPHLQLLMLVLAAHANEGGQAWPTIDRLANMCRVDERTIIRSVHRLEKDGWVAVTRQHRRTNRYQIDLQRLRPVDNPVDTQTLGDAHVTQTAVRVTPTSPKGDAHVTHMGDAHVTPIVRKVKEPPRSGVSPPPSGRRPTLTPEQTHHHANTARQHLNNRRPRPPPPSSSDPNPNGRR